MNRDEMTTILTTEPFAAKRTIDRIKLHTKSLSPDFIMLFPGQNLEEQRKLVEKSEEVDDPVEFWKEVLEPMR